MLVKSRRTYHLLELFNTNFFITFAFIYFLDNVPQYLYLFLFRLQLFMHLRCPTLIITSRVKHKIVTIHITAPSHHSDWRPAFILKVAVILFTHWHYAFLWILNGHLKLTFSLMCQLFEPYYLSLHLLIHL